MYWNTSFDRLCSGKPNISIYSYFTKSKKKPATISMSSTCVFDFANTFWTWTCFPGIFYFATFDNFTTASSCVRFDHTSTCLFTINHGCIFAWAEFTWRDVPWVKRKTNCVWNSFTFASRKIIRVVIDFSTKFFVKTYSRFNGLPLIITMSASTRSREYFIVEVNDQVCCRRAYLYLTWLTIIDILLYRNRWMIPWH